MADYYHYSIHRLLLNRLIKKELSALGGKVLDVGSKNRRYDIFFKADTDIIAVDKIPNKSLQVEFGDLENGLNFVDNQFDAIVCLEVLEYLDNYELGLKEISRLLKWGGKAIVSVPFLFAEHSDNQRFTEQFLKRKCELYFSEAQVSKVGNGFTAIWDIVRAKALVQKNIFIRLILFLCILPYLFLIKLFNLKAQKDLFYSGLFVVLKK